LPKRWISQLLALVAWLLAAGGGGLWFGQPAWWLVGALALWLAATLYKLYDLDKALHGELAHPTVDTTGLWAELLGRVGRYRQKASERKKKYHRLLREVRESTGALRDAGIILNDQHEIQWFNPAAGQLLGLETEKVNANGSMTFFQTQTSSRTFTAMTIAKSRSHLRGNQASSSPCRFFRMEGSNVL
jgi:PAS domain-containing protein